MNTTSDGESPDYPGTPQHQALLQIIVTHYHQNPRFLAVVVFGSLGRGDWDALSDIDLDVVIADDAVVEAVQELRKLCTAFAPLGEHLAVIVPDGDDAADAVLDSLMMLSVRYHPLVTTKAAIVDSMQVLAGPLDHATIAAAGMANQAASEPPVEQLLDECVRYAAVASVYMQRESPWLSIEVLHRMRTLLIEIYTRTHGGGRALHRFDATAPFALKKQLDAALPQANPHSLHSALAALLNSLESDLPRWTNGQLQITEDQQSVIRQVHARLTHLHSHG
jgi:predicted nucleotidyltransferase